METWRIFLFAQTYQSIFFSFPKIGSDLLRIYHSIESVFSAPREEVRPFFGDQTALWGHFCEAAKKLSAFGKEEPIIPRGTVLLSLLDAAYPERLRHIYDPPPVLAVCGSLDSLSRPAIAIVGARRATEASCEMAYEIARGLAKENIVVVSGMAFGIDAASHEGALEGGGATIAVWGTGIDIVYPSSHRALAKKISKAGALVSEFPCGTRARKHHFPQRNRIISGLSLAVVIVEAAARSGSLITARYALEQGRDVFAVPGRGGDVTSSGNNRLLKEGAMLIESAEDVLTALSADGGSIPLGKKTGHCAKLPVKEPGTDDSFSLDEVMTQLGLGPSEALVALTDLMLAGKVEELPGRRYQWKE